MQMFRLGDLALHKLTSFLYRPYAPTNGQWIARNILSGFFTAPVEALPEITVTDVVRAPDGPRSS